MSNLTSVVLKWTNGREHLATVEEVVNAYVKTRPYPILSYLDSDTGEKVWRIDGPIPVPPPDLSLPIGDTLFNYRSALDHLAWQLVIQGGGTPDEMTAFPICDDIHRYKSQSPKNLNGMTKPMKAAIKKLQPCYGNHVAGDAHLWALQSLNNIDKHRHFNLTIGATDGGLWSPGLPFGAAPRSFIHRGPVENGTILARVPAECMHVNFYPAVHVAFSQTGPNVREVLFGINEIVAGIIESFAAQFFGQRISLIRWL